MRNKVSLATSNHVLRYTRARCFVGKSTRVTSYELRGSVALGANRRTALNTMYIWILIVSLVTADNIVSIEKTIVLNKYCREKDRLITSEENDEYLLVSVEVDTTVVLECRFCNDKEERQTKIWYYQGRYGESPEVVVELGMDNNSSYNRVYTTPVLSLVIKSIDTTDAGIYRCHGEEGQEIENKFNYRIEPIFKEHGAVFTEEGNITEYEKYREIYLTSVITRFAVSRMPDLSEIREDGVTLQVISEWSPWSPCEHCIRNHGYRTSTGYCRLKRTINGTIPNGNDSTIVQFFRKSPLLPCKSVLLKEEFPSVSTAIRYLPEFILREPCRKCPVVKTRRGKKFRYFKRYVLAEGAHLTVACPESSMDMQVVWKKDSITLEKGVGRSFRKSDPEPRVIVDTFATLYLIEVSKREQGNYTCYVGNINMMQVKVIVVSKGRLLTQEFLRHLVYLGFIFLLTSFCYCTGLILAYRRRHTFVTIEPETSTANGDEKVPLVKENE